MGKVLWNKETGQPREYDTVDAREILAANPDLYTDVDPNAKEGEEQAPALQNVANVENEFRREPVGANPPDLEREQPIIRNPVTDVPQMAPPAEEGVAVDASPAEQIKADAEAVKAEEPQDADGDGQVDIPDDWEGLHWRQRVALAQKISGREGLDSAAANEVIAAEAKKRGG
jgi:hypothetical protein